MNKQYFFSCLLFLFLLNPSFAQQPDCRFGTNGKVIDNANATITSSTYYGNKDSKLALIPSDSSYILFGSSIQYDQGTASYMMFVSKHKKDGSLDLGFGQNGYYFISQGSSYFPAVDIKFQGQKMVLLYQYGNTGKVIRLHENGSPDNSFTATDLIYSSGFSPSQLLIGKDQKITVVGTGFTYTSFGQASQQDFLVYRLNVNGGKDASYGNNGSFVIDLNALSNDYTAAAGFDALDRLVIAGRSGNSNPPYKWAVARVIGNGALDNSFDGDGKKLLLETSNYNGIYSLQFGENNTILLTGVINADNTSQSAIVKLNQYGGFVTEFASGGVYTSGIADSWTYASHLFPDGKIILGINALSTFCTLKRLNADGSPDVSFGDNSCYFFEQSYSLIPAAIDICALNDNLILVSTHQMESFHVDRIVLDGSTDNICVTNSSYLFPNPTSDHTTFHFELVADGDVSIRLYDYLGKQQIAFMENTFFTAGAHNVVLDFSEFKRRGAFLVVYESAEERVSTPVHLY